VICQSRAVRADPPLVLLHMVKHAAHTPLPDPALVLVHHALASNLPAEVQIDRAVRTEFQQLAPVKKIVSSNLADHPLAIAPPGLAQIVQHPTSVHAQQAAGRTTANSEQRTAPDHHAPVPVHLAATLIAQAALGAVPHLAPVKMIAHSVHPADRVHHSRMAAALIAVSRVLALTDPAHVLAAAYHHRPDDPLGPTNPDEALTVND
jgi:hypothetical protein